MEELYYGEGYMPILSLHYTELHPAVLATHGNFTVFLNGMAQDPAVVHGVSQQTMGGDRGGIPLAVPCSFFEFLILKE